MDIYRGRKLCSVRDAGQLIEVFDDGKSRSLHFGTPARQSSMALDAPDRLQLPYTQAMMAFLLFQPQPEAVLMVGLGGGSMAKFLLRHERAVSALDDYSNGEFQKVIPEIDKVEDN